MKIVKKNKTSKRILALFLSLAMMVTSMPIISLAADDDEYVDTSTTWTEVASSDFTTNAVNSSGESVTWEEDSSFSSGWGKYTFWLSTRYCWKEGTYLYNLSDTYDSTNDKTFSWTMGSYLDGDVSNDNAWSSSTGYTSNPLDFYSTNNYSDGGSFGNNFTEDGTYVANGYLYLSGYSDSGTNTTPITNSDSFKIDLVFSPSSSFSPARTDRYGFLTIGSSSTLSKETGDMASDYLFAQSAYGDAYSNVATSVDTNDTDGKDSSYDITVNAATYNSLGAGNSDVLEGGTFYHYIVSYSKGYIRSYVTDDDGNILCNLAGAEADIDTSAITSIAIGDDNCDYYCQGMTYQSITFYTGESVSTSASVDADQDKYVMAYFTGNDEAGEQICLAVSDDGLNWEALNGGEPILDNTVAEGNEDGSGGIAASGHARDPYLFRAEDGSFYVLATDLESAAGNYDNNTRLLVWHVNELTDLDTASPWSIDMSKYFNGDGSDETVTTTTSSNQRAWAPQAIWDPTYNDGEGAYMLYWSEGWTNEFGSSQCVMYYVYTQDFKTLLTAPKLLYNCSNRGATIDGDITYDGNLYYLYYKDESNETICWATSENASGPYTGLEIFTETSYSGFEGCQVFRRTDGSYVLMMDNYGASDAAFMMYTASSLDGFEHNMVSLSGGYTLNYLSPRHGSVENITTEEADALVAKFGKSTYDASGLIADDGDVNDYLIARYFTDSDVTYDATGNGHTLTNNGVTATVYNGKVCAAFSGSSSSGASGSPGETDYYATIDASDLFEDLIDSDWSGKDGLTFTWWGYATSGDSGRFFDLTDTDAGEIVWNSSADGTETNEKNQKNSSYLYSNSNVEFGGSANGNEFISSGYTNDDYTGAWHEYMMNVSNGCYSFFIDGNLLYTVYAADSSKNLTVSKQGSPVWNTNIDDDYFETLFSGNMLFGISAYAADAFLNGYISDFKIYSKALNPDDIIESEATLSTSVPSTLLPRETDEDGNENYDDAAIGDLTAFYDPFKDETEEESLDGTAKTAYDDNSVTDPVSYTNNFHGVLDDEYIASYASHGTVGAFGNTVNGSDTTYTDRDAFATHNPDGGYSKVSSDTGYTISLWYNPGDTVDETAIFNIGSSILDTGWENREYFYLTEDGTLFFNYQIYDSSQSNYGQSYFDFENAFGDETLEKNTWYHITIEVEPDTTGSYDYIYVFLNGTLVNSAYTFNEGIDTSGNSTLIVGQSVYDYFANANHNVTYGEGCYPDWGDRWSDGTDGYLDNFIIYTGVYLAEDVYEYACISQAESLIYAAIQQYKDMMAELEGADYVYTNMYDAYLAYDRACRYLDSVAYASGSYSADGNYDIEQLVELYTDLESAIDAMEKYTTPSTVEGISANSSGLSTAISSEYTKNMLSSVNLSAMKEVIGGTGQGNEDGYGMNASIASGSFVWLYDGSDMTAPINGGIYVNKRTGVSYKGYAIYKSEGDVSFVGSWHTTTDNTVDWFYDSGYESTSLNYLKSTDSYVNNFDSKTWWYGSNVISYSGDLSDYAAGLTASTGEDLYNYDTDVESYTQYYTTTDPVYYLYGYQSWGFSSYSYVDYEITHPGTIYIINYLPVANVLFDSDRLEVLANITTYSTDSMYELVSAYDNLTSLNYQINASQSAVTNLAKTIEEYVEALYSVDISEEALDTLEFEEFANVATTITDNSSFYNAVTDDDNADEDGNVYALETSGSYEEVTDEEGNNYAYTTSSLEAYTNAYEALQNYFVSLNPYGANVAYPSGENSISTLIDNLYNAQAALTIQADYTQSDTAAANADYIAMVESENTDDDDNQIYTYTAYNTFTTYYNEAKAWSEKAADYRADTEYYAVTYELNEVGPYVVVDENGIPVEKGSDVDLAFEAGDGDSYLTSGGYYYKFFADFYETNEEGATASGYNTGDYVNVDDTFYEVTRYYASTAGSAVDNSQTAANAASNWTITTDYEIYAEDNSSAEYSVRQQQIDIDGDATTTAYDMLSDYELSEEAYNAYDEAQATVAKADNDAYQDNTYYNGEAMTVLERNVSVYGTSTSGATYASNSDVTNAETDKTDVYTTDEYNAETYFTLTGSDTTDRYDTADVTIAINGNAIPYVDVDGTVYKDAATATADVDTTNVINDLNTDTNLKTYTVTFNIYIDGDYNSSKTNTYKYGENVEFDGSSYENNFVLQKWVVTSANSNPTIVKNDSFTLTREIQQDTTVDLYVTAKQSSGTLVTVVDYFGTVLDRFYAKDADTFTYTTDDDNNLCVAADQVVNRYSQTVAVREEVYYTFVSWNQRTNSDGSITTITIYQTGTTSLPDYSVTVSGGTLACSYGTLDGTTEAQTVENVELDTYLGFSCDNEDFYAWLQTINGSTYYVASYDAEFGTYSRDAGMTFIAVTEDELSTYFDADTVEDITSYNVPFSLGTATTTVDLNGTLKFRLHCNYTISDAYDGATEAGESGAKVEIVQYGVLAATGSSAPEDFTKGADGVTTVAATYSTKYSTYEMTTSVLSNKNIYLRSFVSYTVTYDYDLPDGTTKTVTYPRVSYGQVYACDTNGNITSTELGNA